MGIVVDAFNLLFVNSKLQKSCLSKNLEFQNGAEVDGPSFLSTKNIEYVQTSKSKY